MATLPPRRGQDFGPIWGPAHDPHELHRLAIASLPHRLTIAQLAHARCSATKPMYTSPPIGIDSHSHAAAQAMLHHGWVDASRALAIGVVLSPHPYAPCIAALMLDALWCDVHGHVNGM